MAKLPTLDNMMNRVNVAPHQPFGEYRFNNSTSKYQQYAFAAYFLQEHAESIVPQRYQRRLDDVKHPSIKSALQVMNIWADERGWDRDEFGALLNDAWLLQEGYLLPPLSPRHTDYPRGPKMEPTVDQTADAESSVAEALRRAGIDDDAIDPAVLVNAVLSGFNTGH